MADTKEWETGSRDNYLEETLFQLWFLDATSPVMHTCGLSGRNMGVPSRERPGILLF